MSKSVAKPIAVDILVVVTINGRLMPTHKSHLYAEPLSSEVLALIEGLQPWLLEAKFIEYVQGRAENPRRHGFYDGSDSFEKLAPIANKLQLDLQVCA